MAGALLKAGQKNDRYCTVAESLVQSFKEVKLIREGKIKPPSLNDLWTNCETWNPTGTHTRFAARTPTQRWENRTATE